MTVYREMAVMTREERRKRKKHFLCFSESMVSFQMRLCHLSTHVGKFLHVNLTFSHHSLVSLMNHSFFIFFFCQSIEDPCING